MTSFFNRFLPALAAAVSTFASVAWAADVATTPRVEARLVSEVTGIPAAGGTISLALHQRMQPEWHTYWRNPGESGEPTTLSWVLPQGYVASEIKWPHPERIPYGELANYGYSNQILLRAEVTIPPGLIPGDNVTFKVDAAWLVCKDICVPEQATLDLTLPVVESKPELNAAWREAFAASRAREPVPSGPFEARFSLSGEAVTLFFVPTSNRSERWAGAQFFPFTKGLLKASALQVAESRGNGFAIAVPPGWRLRDAQRRGEIDKIDGVLVLGSTGNAIAHSYEVSLRQGAVPASSTGTPASQLPLVQAILFAILGGLILNLMPCVFPILSMKALALVRSGHAAHPWVDGIAYLLGVMTTFAGLAGALLWLRSTGEDVGWGFQLQSPLSVAALAYVLALIGFNLSGLFNFGSSLQGAGESLSRQTGLAGAFFTGVLAVIVAAPCTAPFMGAAMSYAFTQSPAITIAIFLALGFGLALPWVIFSFSPALIRLLPKPGAWMERFKQFLAFPMYAAAVWLVWVLSQQVTPEGLFRVMIGLVFLALSAWALGAAQAKRSLTSVVLFGVGFAAAIALVTLPLEGRKSSPEPTKSEGVAGLSQPYTALRLAELRAQGRSVFVNLTAAWCVSCLYNERIALSSAKVRDAFKSTNTTYLVGDWTNQNHEISALLRQHARDGVPLYLYFPPGGGEPEVLPQILTESLMLTTLGTKK